MWSSLFSSGQSTENKRSKRENKRPVNVGNFVISNINDAFYALRLEGFSGSNCYALLYTLTKSSITSDKFQPIEGRLFDVMDEGTTNIYDEFPRIYYRMLQRVLINTSDLNIQQLLEYKQLWLRNPSHFVNKILGEACARKLIAQGTEAQNNAISKACKPIKFPATAAGGADRTCYTSVVFNGASREQQNRCCICGLGQPPQLTDIEHVVSSQLLISLGICPGTRSFVGFREIFNELRGAGGTNWVEIIINYFPVNSRDAARSAFRSIMLPAHAYCNQTIKGELSPFYIDVAGNIQANINKSFEDMGSQTYAERVIEPSIYYVNNPRTQKGTPRKLGGEELSRYISSWKVTQQRAFKAIAWLLNSIDQRNNDASWFLFNRLYKVARDGDNVLDKAAFAELVRNILGYKDVINWKDVESELRNDTNILKIKTTLTLLVQSILVLFQADVQTPKQKATPRHIGRDADYSFEGTESSSDDGDASISSISEDEVAYINANQNLSGSDVESDKSVNKSQLSRFSNEFANPSGKKRLSPVNKYKSNRAERQIKRATLNNNQIIDMEAYAAVNEYYSGSVINEIIRGKATRIATNAARAALSNAANDDNLYEIAYDAAMDALNANGDDGSDLSIGLGGGSRKRKYTKRGRHSTRKRRPSKKQRRTIRRPRRNNKRTQKRLK